MSGTDKEDFTLPASPASRVGFNRVATTSGVSYLDGNGQIIGELPPGYIVGQQFRVRNTLGEGGMSFVYLCDDISLNRQVAVKVMRAGAQSNDQAFMRFHREGQAVAMLSHNNVVKVHSLSFTEVDQPFLVMEVVQGVPLSDLIEISGPLKLPRALKFLSQICDGISHAHANGVIHRDLKLSNIMLIEPDSRDERIKILDFGIAKVVTETSVKMTQTGEVFGSPAYMSPEQALGKAVDMSTDQYSLGCIAFELLTGRTPFASENYLAVLMAHVQEAAPSVNEFLATPVPVNIERTIARLLAKDPKNRFGSIDEVKKAFTGEMKVAAPVKVKVKKPINTRYLGFAAAFIACVSTIGALMYIMRPQPPKTVAADNAVANREISKKLQPLENTLMIASETLDDGTATGKMISAINRTTFGDSLSKTAFSDTGLQNIHAAKNLRKLNLIECKKLTPKGIVTIATFPRLEELDLNKTATDDSCLEALSKMPTLTHLSVDNCDAITDKGIAYLSDMPNLEDLWIANIHSLTPECLKSVAKIKSLQRLHVDNNELGPGFKYLAKNRLIFLSASGNHPTTEDVMPLAKLHSLEYLSLDRAGVEKQALFALARLPRLRVLSVKQTALSKATIEKFHSLAPNCELKYDKKLVETKDFN